MCFAGFMVFWIEGYLPEMGCLDFVLCLCFSGGWYGSLSVWEGWLMDYRILVMVIYFVVVFVFVCLC